MLLSGSVMSGTSGPHGLQHPWPPCLHHLPELAQTHSLKAFDCVDHNKLWKILKEIGIPDHLTCLLRNMYIDQETTVRTRTIYCHPAYLTSLKSAS